MPGERGDRQVDDVRDQRRQPLRPPRGDLVEDQQLGAAEGEPGGECLRGGSPARTQSASRPGSTICRVAVDRPRVDADHVAAQDQGQLRLGGEQLEPGDGRLPGRLGGRVAPLSAASASVAATRSMQCVDGRVEAVALVGEELVEGRAGDRGAGDEVGDRRRRVGLLGAAGDHRVEDPARCEGGVRPIDAGHFEQTEAIPELECFRTVQHLLSPAPTVQRLARARSRSSSVRPGAGVGGAARRPFS